MAGYEIEEQVGAGGMAVVFRARDEMLGRLATAVSPVLVQAMAKNPEDRYTSCGEFAAELQDASRTPLARVVGFTPIAGLLRQAGRRRRRTPAVVNCR